MRFGRLCALVVMVAAMALGSSGAYAWHIHGYVFCDTNEDCEIQIADDRIAGVVVNVVDVDTNQMWSGTTDENGFYKIYVNDTPATYSVTLDEATLPPDAVFKIPAGKEYVIELTDEYPRARADWLIDSSLCKEGQCWMTGGGVKFDPITDEMHAEKGPNHSMGGNVYPGCDPDHGDGGHWNHVWHKGKLHFKGNPITSVRCGNVDGIDPGSESPVTPFNFIEFSGTGTLKGIKGNKADYGEVCFFARAEDRNEPGGEAGGNNSGADIDRYFLHVFADCANPAATTLMCVDADGDCSTVDPVTITGGNIQLHDNPCGN